MKTKKDAEKLWCPHVRMCGEYASYNREHDNTGLDLTGCLCISDRCTMWVPNGPDRGECGLICSVGYGSKV